MNNGVLCQLAATGHEDQYLTVKPETTLWKNTFKRSTNFASDWLSSDMQIKVDAKDPGLFLATIKLPRNGDLVFGMEAVVQEIRDYQCNLLFPGRPASYNADRFMMVLELLIGSGMTDCKGFVETKATLDRAAIFIGNNPIETIYSEYEEYYSQTPNPSSFQPSMRARIDGKAETVQESRLDMPFWFCRNRQHALPVIALPYHDIEIKLWFRFNGRNPKVSLESKFAFLDASERRLFATTSHESVYTPIRHHKYTIGDSTSQGTVRRFRIVLNHPTTHLLLRITDANGKVVDGNDVLRMTLKFDNHIRMSNTGSYYMYRSPQQYNMPVDGKHFLLSFSENPGDRDASSGVWHGSCNFGRIDHVVIEVDFGDSEAIQDNVDARVNQHTLDVYQQHTQVLRIMSGMAALVYTS
jgi:hypothetical protein